MAKFLVRIELHNATYADYEKLHSEMEYLGFSRQITADNGQTYQLPTAEYVIGSTLDLDKVRAYAAAAAKSTGRKFGIIAAEYSRSAWMGLAYA